MRAYGICVPPTTSDRGVPVPMVPLHREGADIVARLERAQAWKSPIVLSNPVEFTTTQLAKPVRKPSRKRAPGRPATVDREAVVDLYVDEGLSVPQIARQVKAGESTVRGILDDAGIQRVRRGDPAGVKSKVDVTVAKEMLAQGASLSEIGAVFEVTGPTVGRALRKVGVSSPRSRPPVPPKADVDPKVVVARYEDGLTIKEVSLALNVSRTTVRRILDAEQVVCRDDRGRAGGRAKLSDAVLAEAARLYEGGMTSKQVAATLGIGLKSVAKARAVTKTTVRSSSIRGENKAVALADQLAAVGATSADVRAWAAHAGVACPSRGVPPAGLVFAYLEGLSFPQAA